MSGNGVNTHRVGYKEYRLYCRESAPISSRLNAIDLYLVVCIFLVFGKTKIMEIYLTNICLLSNSTLSPLLFSMENMECGNPETPVVWLIRLFHLLPGALMEYAAILLLLKKRRKPLRTIDQGLRHLFTASNGAAAVPLADTTTREV